MVAVFAVIHTFGTTDHKTVITDPSVATAAAIKVKQGLTIGALIGVIVLLVPNQRHHICLKGISGRIHTKRNGRTPILFLATVAEKAKRKAGARRIVVCASGDFCESETHEPSCLFPSGSVCLTSEYEKATVNTTY
jgi:hypothetical protein